MILESISPFQSSQAGAPYIARLNLDSRSIVLSWQQVVDLHETARALCPQKFACWFPLPPELWITSLIFTLEQPPTSENLPHTKAMRIDLLQNRQ